LHLGTREDSIPEATIQVLGPYHIHAVSSQETREFFLDRNKPKAHDMTWFKLDQHIYVAVRSEIVPQDRAEEGQSADMLFPAELGQLVAVNGYPNAHT
jgi:hypothetical protein